MTKNTYFSGKIFLALVEGYKDKKGMLTADWRVVLENGYLSKLGWLEYSLKRSLWIECTDKEEQQMGTDQVTGTTKAIKSYANMIFEIEDWLNNNY